MVDQLEYVLLICEKNENSYEISLDIESGKKSLQLYGATVSNDGVVSNLERFPNGEKHEFKNPSVDAAVEELKGFSEEDLERTVGNQFSVFDPERWAKVDESCYQYFSEDLDEILNLGSPDQLEDNASPAPAAQVAGGTVAKQTTTEAQAEEEIDAEEEAETKAEGDADDAEENENDEDDIEVDDD
jgi:hypothetical protein